MNINLKLKIKKIFIPIAWLIAPILSAIISFYVVCKLYYALIIEGMR